MESARRAACVYLDQGRRPGDLVGVFSIDRTLAVVQEFTTDDARLRRAAEALGSRAAAGESAQTSVDAEAAQEAETERKVEELLRDLDKSSDRQKLEWLTQQTGGFLVRDTNDLAGPLRRIDADLHTYYGLGYTPANDAWDGRFRTIAVKVRRPGLRVRARCGYFAVRASGPMPANVAPALALLERGARPRELEVAATSELLEASVGGGRVSVEAAVDGERLRQATRRHGADVTIVGRLRRGGAGGVPVEAFSERCQLDLSKPGNGRSPDCRLRREVSLIPGRYGLEVAAYEALSRLAAVVSSEFELQSGAPLVAGASEAPAPAISSPSAAKAEASDPRLAKLLERAGRYVIDYEASFRNVVAEETCTQWAGDIGERRDDLRPSRRVTRADMAFVRLAGDIPWGSFRDVFEVDGQKVRDQGRLERIFAEPSLDPVARARAWRRAHATISATRFGTSTSRPCRCVFLHPRNQPRFHWRLGGRRTIAGTAGVELQFQENVRPTLISDGLSGEQLLAFRERTEATARYSNFRQFTVRMEEKATLPEK